MINIGGLWFSNVFSYGSDNYIDFQQAPITQLVGLNGHGKSSIALILELVLFNKNSKNIKTGRILNRYIDVNYYTIKLQLWKDDDEYIIDTKRASTQTIKLLKNGEDISSHTATGTFKLIEEILGFDHKTFCQLVYQSSAQSLEFLSATDTNRKKFLIDLLSLEKYSDAFEIFKKVSKEVSDELAKHENSVEIISAWLDKNSKIDLNKKSVLEVPVALINEATEKSKTEQDISRIEFTNRSIQTNNTYKAILEGIEAKGVLSKVLPERQDESAYVKEKTELEKDLKDSTAFIAKVKALKDSCPTCGHAIDNSQQLSMVGEKEEIKEKAEKALIVIAGKLLKIRENNKILSETESEIARWEQHHALYDETISSEKLDKNNLEARVVQLEKEIKKRDLEIAEAIKANTLISAHNSKVDVISQQMVEMRTDLEKASASLSLVNVRLTNLQILQKAFSTNGLIAYKIESMVKDLEDLVNQYLAELSYGRFQLAFVIAGEKLNVVISDNGLDVEILELSAGEKARVNTATLLAIRKLMQQLSNTKINVLILDETVENLDLEGKEKLIEILVKEEHLNTFLISHSFSHPLLEKIHIIKENNISRLDR